MSRFGFGVQYQTPWPLPFIGFGLVSFGTAAIPSVTYYGIWYHPWGLILISVIDAYFPVAYEGLVMVNAFKQIFAFGFSYGIVPWVTLDTFQGAFGAMAGIQVALMLFGIPLWYYGKQELGNLFFTRDELRLQFSLNLRYNESNI
jgi:hypothetical protein